MHLFSKFRLHVCGMVSKFKLEIEKQISGFTKQVYTFLLTSGQQRAHRNWTFGKISWLAIDQRFKQCLSTSVFKFFSEMCPQYMNEIYQTTIQNNTVTRNSSLKLFQPLKIMALSQKCFSYLGLFIWNGLPDDVKLSNNVNTFKYKVKKTFLTLLREKYQDIYVYYG